MYLELSQDIIDIFFKKKRKEKSTLHSVLIIDHSLIMNLIVE